MLIRPRPSPPYLPIYPLADQPEIHARYDAADREWQREVEFGMWSNCAIVFCAAVALIAAAIIGPQIILDAILILAA